MVRRRKPEDKKKLTLFVENEGRTRICKKEKKSVGLFRERYKMNEEKRERGWETQHRPWRLVLRGREKEKGREWGSQPCVM